MIEARDGEPMQCPNCDTVIKRDPLVGWWLCDDCALAVDGDGERVA
ncbi:hypothetical protein [Natrinema sp. SYSU A 869]|nr:hypothetical protein [Natrinema sp. SYSU A 869]